MSKHVDILIERHNATLNQNINPDTDPITREFADWLAWIQDSRERRKRGQPITPEPLMPETRKAQRSAPGQCRTCGHLGYTAVPERPCALCDAIMQGDQDTLAEIGRMMAQHGYDPHVAAEELRQLATKGQ